MKILLNILGIAIYFLNRFNNRKDKKAFSFPFWVKDNWAELLMIALIDVSVVLLLLSNDVSIDIAQFIPSWLVTPGDLTLYWIVGLGLSSLVYNAIKRKTSVTNKNNYQ